MKYLPHLCLAFLLTLAMGCDSDPMSDTDGEGTDGPGGGVGAFEKIDDEYLVAFNDDTQDVTAVVNSLMSLISGEVLFTYDAAFLGFAVRTDAAGAATLEADLRVQTVEPNYLLRLLPEFANFSGGSGQQTPYGIEAVGGAQDGTGLRAWVIDTGIDYDHADLNVDESLSQTFVPGTLSADDENGHGTHVAGTIAARDNGQDVVGVAPNATLVSVRVLGADGSGTYASIIAGLDYVAERAQPGEVANLSLGGPASTLVDLAARNTADRGIRLAIAAGNDNAPASDYSPARVNHENIRTVSAVDANKVFASFSNFGNPPVDFAAPGVRILSTKLGGGVTYLSGTSMAAPHVAGLWLFDANIDSQGTAQRDPDGNADPLAHR